MQKKVPPVLCYRVRNVGGGSLVVLCLFSTCDEDKQSAEGINLHGFFLSTGFTDSTVSFLAERVLSHADAEAAEPLGRWSFAFYS
jgi:hypothetical protein